MNVLIAAGIELLTSQSMKEYLLFEMWCCLFPQSLLYRVQTINKDRVLARTNYSFEKRKKELAKKKKKEEKRQRKLEKQNSSAGENENLPQQED